MAAGLAEDPGDLELLTLRADERLLADDPAGFLAAKKDVFARNPEFSRFYEITAEFAEWEHRYGDIVAMMKEAVALDPDDGKAFAELGLTQMRDGDEQDGLASLRKAWSLDHFNVRVFNTLNLYEQTISKSYDLASENVFTIRYPKDEEPVLSRYVPRLLGEAWGSMKARYDFAPSTPVQVELYSNREQFSVRTSGLPNIGIEGVCFGHVLAAMSPKSEPINWGNVLWHELGHVFAIQLSRSHVPRWFTEGLSEYETIVRRPEWHRELDAQLYQALVAGRLPGAAQMNRAFTHAASDEDMTVAYYASSQMLVFIAEQFGMPAIVRALALWGEGKRTAEVVRGAFAVPPEELDARYRAWQKARLARYDGQYMLDDRPLPLAVAKAKAEAAPGDAKLRAAYALTLLHERKADEARAALDAALKVDPARADGAVPLGAPRAGAQGPCAQGPHARRDASRRDGRRPHRRLRRADGEGRARGGQERLGRHEASARGRCPLRPDPGRPAQASPCIRRRGQTHGRRHRSAPASGPARPARSARLADLARAARRGEALDDALRVGESAVFVDVESAAIHIGYGRALAAAGQHARAAFEMETATLCPATPKVRANAGALLARERLALGDTKGAKQARDDALRLDPTNAEAAGVVIEEPPAGVK